MSQSLNSVIKETGLLIKAVEWIYLNVVSAILGTRHQPELDENVTRRYSELKQRCRKYHRKLAEIINSGLGKTGQCLTLIEFIGELEKLGRLCARVPGSIEIYQLNPGQAKLDKYICSLSDEVEVLFSKIEESFLNRDQRQIKQLRDSATILRQRFDLVLLDIARADQKNDGILQIAGTSAFFKTVLDGIEQMLGALQPDDESEQTGNIFTPRIDEQQ